MMPVHQQLANSSKLMDKVLSSMVLKEILVGLIPKSKKFTKLVRKSPFKNQDYDILQL